MSNTEDEADNLHGSSGETREELLEGTSNHNAQNNHSKQNEGAVKGQAAEPSIFRKLIRDVFGFRKTSLTLFVILTYIFILALVAFAKDRSLSVPSTEPEILRASWLDLQKISHKPHPYVSHANDDVHDYILERVTELAAKSKFVTVSDDAKEKLSFFKIIESWSNSSQQSPLHHFESSNVLVKIEGQDPSLDGLLLSAHYDSVPTAYGTTDDGTGIASMLGILEHFTSLGSRPLRTIVFNFNNNEEFGLFGAEAFLNHPWKKLVKYFINLEGTGTGERAILFRSSDYEVAKLYQSVRSPFGTSIFQQGFASGFVRSETDYRVYTRNGLRGVDIAFYKPRSLYHTAEDSIRYSSKNALWHMLSNALDLTTEIANADEIGDDSETQAVFFDILGYFFVVLPLSSLIIANISLLSIIPVALILLGIVIKKRKIWNVGYAWIRVIISVSIAIFVTKLLLETIYHINPYIVSKDFYSPLLSLTSVFLFINYALLTISNHFWPVHDFKLVITLEFFIVLWLFLLYSTIQQSQSSAVSGEYLITIIYALYSVSAFLGLLSISIASRSKPDTSKYIGYGTIENDVQYQYEGDSQHAQDETAPLLSNSFPDSETESENTDSVVEDNAHPEHNSFTYDWSLQFLLLVPLNFLFTYTSFSLILEGINQTVQESLESHHFVFVVILAASITLAIPLVSFSYKLNYLFALFLVLSAVLGTFNSLFSEPFTPEAPLKFRFAQTIDLDSSVPNAKVEVYAREGFLPNILEDLPSVKSSDQNVTCKAQSDGNELCEYAAERPYLFNGTSDDLFSYLTVTVKKSDDNSDPSPYAPLTAEIEINVKDNRACTLAFNTTSYKTGSHGKSPLRLVTYYQDKQSNKSLHSYPKAMASVPSGPSKDANGNEVFKHLSGIDSVNLHKLNWDQQSYHIGLQWIPKWLEDGEEQEPSDSPNNQLGVTVSCYWGEYDDVSVIDGEIKRKMPAYDELLEYTPRYTSFSNRYEGLVRADRYITL